MAAQNHLALPNDVIPSHQLGATKPHVTQEQLDGAGLRPLRTKRGIHSYDSEIRFADAVAWGPVPAYRPDLGPCLIFLGAVNQPGGYGQFSYGQKNGYAHRYAWERERGPIPDDLTVDHLCRVRRCVRLSHLELVDGLTNYIRGVQARGSCPNGHEYTPDNIRPISRRSARKTAGYEGRECLTCHREQVRRGGQRRSRSANGLPNRRIKYEQGMVRAQLVAVRAGECTIAQAARVIGCNPNYLGRRAWEETRRDVLVRDGGCVRCGSTTDGLDAHHRRPRRIGGASDPITSFGMANVIALCRGCHEHVERNRTEAVREGFLIAGTVAQPAEVPILRHGWVWQIPTETGWETVSGPVEDAA